MVYVTTLQIKVHQASLAVCMHDDFSNLLAALQIRRVYFGSNEILNRIIFRFCGISIISPQVYKKERSLLRGIWIMNEEKILQVSTIHATPSMAIFLTIMALKNLSLSSRVAFRDLKL